MSNKERLNVIRKKYDKEITDFYKNFTDKLKKKGPKYGPNNTNPKSKSMGGKIKGYSAGGKVTATNYKSCGANIIGTK
jgi:hypothetical protein